ncbi:MAG TPA: 3-dehydroquinate synthase II [Candidatus Altiarchaeales archaeon]|nr:3-dehydroquinate synthase II [Candidatus Altiarchaeales archaeon]
MKRELWVRADQDREWEERKVLVTTALETGADAVMVGRDETKKVKELGKIPVVSEDESADITLVKNIQSLRGIEGKKAFYKEIKCKDDEEEVSKAGRLAEYVVVRATDWKVIPLENLIADLKGKTRIIVEVANERDAKLALETLEIGSDGVLVNAGVNEIKKTRELIDKISTERVNLQIAKVTKVKPVGMGDRVCVDTCSVFNIGEGMLIGSQSNALFLIHSETIETPYVATRPFRVNAGPVHAYTRMPDGKTKYLSELKAGDDVLAVDFKGNTRRMVVGRLKIEKRPLMLIEAEANGKKLKTLVQNAETIRLVDKKGKAISVANLKEGDEVLTFIEDAGRHFGMKVEESIEER